MVDIAYCIGCLGFADDPVMNFAAEELSRCLGEMTGQSFTVVPPAPLLLGGCHFQLGLFGDFPDLEPIPVPDPRWDDAYVMRSTPEGVVIAGVNSRSVLLGVYRYLRELGARWLWPGADGEYLPARSEIPLTGFDLRWQAAFRHRAVCIEGAVSLEHELDFVEWMPRVGLNAFMLQFQNSGYFWRLWYGHEVNDLWPEKRTLSDAEAAALDDKVIAALKQRGLLLHRVGHGWCAVALGFDVSSGWPEWEGAFPEASRHLMAEVKGKRDLWKNSPVNTELCYSQPEARERFMAAVLDYAREHPETDALHIWLSDAMNNTCECPDCSKLTPADWYLTLLNELAPRLREINPDLHVVFLCYFNTLWPPTQVRLDPDNTNVIFMYAPITRCYQHRLGDPDCGERLGERPPINQVAAPCENVGNVQLLQAWQPFMPADSFVFDYHFWTPWRLDYFAYDLAGLIPGDVADYEALGMGGLMCCGSQRVFWPTGWPLQRTALLLSGESTDGEEERYCELAYGERWQVAAAFLAEMTRRRACPEHGQNWWAAVSGEQAAENVQWLRTQESVLAEAAATAVNNRERQAWALLVHFRNYAQLLWQVVEAWHAGGAESALPLLAGVEEFIKRTEKEVHRFSDGYLQLMYLAEMRRRMGSPVQGAAPG